MGLSRRARPPAAKGEGTATLGGWRRSGAQPGPPGPPPRRARRQRRRKSQFPYNSGGVGRELDDALEGGEAAVQGGVLA